MNVDLTTVTNPNAPLALAKPSTRGRASPRRAADRILQSGRWVALAIGQYWEDTHRQSVLRYPMGPVNVWNWKATIDPFKAPQPLLGNQVARFGLDEFMDMAHRNGMPASEVHCWLTSTAT